MKRDVFQAIADPTRRAIIQMLAHEPMNVNAVSDHFSVTRAAVYKHMKILTESGLLVLTQQGRERICEAKLEKLDEVSEWIEKYRKEWNHRLDALEEYLEELQSKKIKAKSKSPDKKQLKKKKHGNEKRNKK
jgi:DNA-binding transcriptional ArsR family regulator